MSDWRPYDGWVEAGSKDTRQRAGEIATQMLREFEAPAMEPAIREELDAYVAKRKEELA